ncbi:hypothetical protein QYH69_12535 [Paraburkholderia sp. SARCC-3016]|uniref:hypothetical protein n=1 Tax=Paraburkholderia sp. SARCC-3016 TaxID=3058611 RepID=UPI002809AD0C|nr:hypothetical protein [Paraburkholderia sp. SARCC-3016]MDQ7978069.1 hypothetical protein [Paraburkholderia sp. SARCC-3016]
MSRFMRWLRSGKELYFLVTRQNEAIERLAASLADHSKQLALQAELLGRQSELLDFQGKQIEKQLQQLNVETNRSAHVAAVLESVRQGQADTAHLLTHSREEGLTAAQLAKLNPRMRRNFLPNDSAVAQKQLMATWAAQADRLCYVDFLDSGFRVFSQNDEDGVLLRIFSAIGATNRYVIEIGSNCSDSDIGLPENLSTNLIVNHAWHGAIFEIDPTECARMRYFFARDFATKHFHVDGDAGRDGYYSPVIVEKAVSPDGIDRTLLDVHDEKEPDLMIIDIDGGDYAVVQAMTEVRPRVLVVEFEKRFRDRHSVVQFETTQFSKRWPQSGAASLLAWKELLASKGYVLCTIGSCGFNAFFVRSDVAEGKVCELSPREAFDRHPILSKVREPFWRSPDDTWQAV